MSNRIYVAIDTPDLARAQALAQKVRGRGISAGRYAPSPARRQHRARRRIPAPASGHRHGLPIFLDLKLHDIPNTVAKAVQSLGPLAPAILTVCAQKNSSPSFRPPTWWRTFCASAWARARSGVSMAT
jgi:orotidine-5'-phosphate decarboxylase